MSRAIKEGDIVDIHFVENDPKECPYVSNCEVIYISQNFGELWELKDESGWIWAVNPCSSGFSNFTKKPQESK